MRHLSRTYMIRDGTPQAAPWDFDVDGLEEPRRCTTCRMPTDWDSPSRRSQVIEVGHEAQLFIDDHLIADWVGLQRVQNSPRVRYLMSEEEAYASQRPGEYLQGRSAKLGDGGTWFMVDGKAFNPPQFRHTPEFPAFVDLSADAKTTTLQMGESRITWTMPSRRAAHTPVAANKVGHDAAYDAYLPELPVTRGWFHEVPVNLFPSVAARMAAGSEGFHPRTSRMNQCTDDSNSPQLCITAAFTQHTTAGILTPRIRVGNSPTLCASPALRMATHSMQCTVANRRRNLGMEQTAKCASSTSARRGDMC